MIIDDRAGAIDRRRLLGLAALAAAGTLVGCSSSGSGPAQPPGAPATATGTAAPVPVTTPPPTAAAVWTTLLDGNARFAAGNPAHPHADPSWRAALAEEQHPVATVLSCADSRVAPELIFDQGLGDLFTIRSAGEVLDEAVIGSIEYGVEHLATPLVVVLGHTGCGAVRAAIDVVHGAEHPHGDVAALVDAIEPAVRSVPVSDDEDAFAVACVAEQARRVAAALPDRSEVLATAVADGSLGIVVATYDLDTGVVGPLT
ncbi:MAG TPA: carbonic anhydrase [Jiangellaceae bacterium]